MVNQGKEIGGKVRQVKKGPWATTVGDQIFKKKVNMAKDENVPVLKLAKHTNDTVFVGS